jgi:hypothetical protein
MALKVNLKRIPMLKYLIFATIGLTLICCFDRETAISEVISDVNNDTSFEDFKKLRTDYYKGDKDLVLRFSGKSSRDHITTIPDKQVEIIWTQSKRDFLNYDDKTYFEDDFLTYSDEYLKYLEKESKHKGSEWLKQYLELYKVFNEFGPSLQAYMMELEDAVFRDQTNRDVGMIHFLTCDFNANHGR